MTTPLYFDYAATTPVDSRVAEKMLFYLMHANLFANPASIHSLGKRAKEVIETAREQVAACIQASPQEVIWTSGATEANNLGIQGAAHFYQAKGRHIVTTIIEHKSILDTCKQLEREKFEITYLKPQASGLIDLAELESVLRPDTLLVSLAHANNETGVVQDIAAIAQLTRYRGILLHVDAAQSAGKIPIDLNSWPVDLMSLSAHKIYGPKGIGALFVRKNPRVSLSPLMHGGTHERGLRAGTLATHQIAGMGEAYHIAQNEMVENDAHAKKCRALFWKGIHALPHIYLNADFEHSLPHILNISVGYVSGEAMLMDLQTLCVSSGAACNSASTEPSYVLQALGRSYDLAESSLRFSWGRFTTESEIEQAVQAVKNAIHRLRAISPRWEEVNVHVV